MNMAQLIEKLVVFAFVWTLSVFLSIVASVQLIFLYIVRFKSLPWKLKDRILMEAPACLTNPIYGTHKFVTLNVYKNIYGDKEGNKFFDFLFSFLPLIFLEIAFSLH